MKRGMLLPLLGAASLAAIIGLCGGAGGQTPSTVTVRDAAGLRQAVAQAKPGATIRIAPGEYAGGHYFSNLRGAAGRPIVLTAADPKNPPVFKGAGEGIHLSDAAYVELRDLTIRSMSGNGINIDDGGSYETPAHHIVLRNLRISDIGPKGNHDGIKISGLDDFRIEGCTFERVGGQCVDMVGCHRGVIEQCTFREGDPAYTTGVQAKGGTRDVAVRRCRFEDAGARGVNIGGSTGLEFFRPKLDLRPGGAPRNAEAKDITVEGCTFVGGQAPVAFVGVDGATVRYNTIYRPGRWAIRILQETREPTFVPSQKGVFTDNIVAFSSGQWAEGGVNIGPGTAPQTFTFARNLWYCLDQPARSRPTLPTPEKNGVYGKDPQFRDAAKGDLRVRAGSPASKVGAHALPR